MNWTNIPPSEPGWYFIYRKGKTEITEVWYVESDGLWTNEERGKQVSSEYYKDVFWQGPIDLPPPPCDYCDEDGRVEIDNNGPIGPCPICGGTKTIVKRCGNRAENKTAATETKLWSCDVHEL